jgi:hypothetical protein
VTVTNLVAKPDGTVVSFDKDPTEDRIEFNLPTGWVAAIRVELLPANSTNGSVLRGDRDSASIGLNAAMRSSMGTRDSLPFSFADASFKEPRYANGFEIPGVQTGWKTSAAHRTQVHSSIWLLEKPRRVAEGDRLVLTLKNNPAARIRVSVSPFAIEPAAWNSTVRELSSALRKDSIPPKPLAASVYHRSTAWNEDTLKELRRLDVEMRECNGGTAWTLVSASTNPIVTRVLPRGNWQNETGDVVLPAPPHFLPQPDNDGRRLTRLDLARWLVSTNNPLTARTFVNRTWKQFFGTGISAVVDDLGAQGEWPVHPELLDWLAIEFMDSGWDVKHLVKLMVMSATYRQNSNQRQDLKDIDPNNRLLASQSPRRLEAEFVRDNALAIAGLLNPDVGGPSAHPYQPPDYYVNLQFPDRDYIPDRDARQYRRGVYSHWQRTFLQPMLANFDAPSREECTAIRTVSNTPQQALTLLNDPTFIEAARVFAEKVLTSNVTTDDERIAFAFQRALARPARSNEKQSLDKFLAGQRDLYRSNPADADKLLRIGVETSPRNLNPIELAAWTSVCRVILNLHETITRY